jgi:hypothetical protein
MATGFLEAPHVQGQVEHTGLHAWLVHRFANRGDDGGRQEGWPPHEPEAELCFTVDHNWHVITRRPAAVSDGDKPRCQADLVPGTGDFDAESRIFMTLLSGGRARERGVVARELDDGLTVAKSSRGASSHPFNPLLVILPGREPDEKRGECLLSVSSIRGTFRGRRR